MQQYGGQIGGSPNGSPNVGSGNVGSPNVGGNVVGSGNIGNQVAGGNAAGAEQHYINPQMVRFRRAVLPLWESLFFRFVWGMMMGRNDLMLFCGRGWYDLLVRVEIVQAGGVYLGS